MNLGLAVRLRIDAVEEGGFWRRAAAAALLSLPLLAHGAAATAEAALVLSRGTGAGDTIEYTLEELAAMPQVVVVTQNEFADGLVTYRGPLVRDVIAGLGWDRTANLRFTAVNDYSVDIPAEEFFDYDIILAMQADGQMLSRREKGPLWLMYPITDNPQFQGPPYNDRLIWQVVKIDAL